MLLSACKTAEDIVLGLKVIKAKCYSFAVTARCCVPDETLLPTALGSKTTIHKTTSLTNDLRNIEYRLFD